ncbi:hypothetical protein [Nonomuraea dietziae]|uniref:hypothetical protein n=1 Tax=Nonomuraea dietziae TaxID=65515 RepID=UPI0031E4644C
MVFGEVAEQGAAEGAPDLPQRAEEQGRTLAVTVAAAHPCQGLDAQGDAQVVVEGLLQPDGLAFHLDRPPGLPPLPHLDPVRPQRV